MQHKAVSLLFCKCTLAWPRWKEVAAQKIWPVPEAVVTVLCTPDDGCGWHPKHVEWTSRIINRLFCVACRPTATNIDITHRYIIHHNWLVPRFHTYMPSQSSGWKKWLKWIMGGWEQKLCQLYKGRCQGFEREYSKRDGSPYITKKPMLGLSINVSVRLLH